MYRTSKARTKKQKEMLAHEIAGRRYARKLAESLEGLDWDPINQLMAFPHEDQSGFKRAYIVSFHREIFRQYMKQFGS